MALLYVRSTDGSDADSGATWALAKATITGALAIAAAGDTIYVSQVHAETSASAITMTSLGTAANPVRVVCANDGAEPPTAVATSATVTTTAGVTITFNGYATYYGLIVVAGSGSSSSSAEIRFNIDALPFWFHGTACSFRLATTGTPKILLGTSSTGLDDALIEWDNCTVSFGHVGQGLAVRGARFVWRNTASAVLGTVPTTLFLPMNGPGGPVVCEGVDFSALGSGKNLVSQAVAITNTYRFWACKLGASVAIVTGTHVGPGGTVVELLNGDSGDTHSRHERYVYHGSQVVDTVVYRGSGATDGETSVAWKLTGANTQPFIAPYTTFPVTMWLNSTGSKTLTLSYVHGEAAALTDEEIWLDLTYLGTSGFPLASIATDRKATLLASAASQSTDTASDWDNGATARANSTAYSLGDIRRSATPAGKLFIVTTAGTSAGSEPAGFGTSNDGDAIIDNTATWRQMRREKVNVTVTVNEIGPVVARLSLAKNIAVWVDPLLQGGETSARQYMGPMGGYLNEGGSAAASGGLIAQSLIAGGS